MRGRFIVLEGLDGAGISTQARRLAALLDQQGANYYCTREPTDGPVGSQIRLALTGRLAVDPTTLALMYAADRSDQIHNTILPRLEAGVSVISERHVLSSLAYQGAQLGDRAWVGAINRQNMRAVTPDLTIFLDVAAETALSRIDTRHARELFEREDTLTATRESFLAAIGELRREGARIETVEAARSIAEVERDVAALVLPLMPNGARPRG